MSKQRGFTVTELLVVVIYAAGIFGWIANIVKIIGSINDPITPMLILRFIGVLLAPLGAVLGFF